MSSEAYVYHEAQLKWKVHRFQAVLVFEAFLIRVQDFGRKEGCINDDMRC
jgi:hypothetical protein